MTATQIRPASRLSALVAGIRTPVESHAEWAEPDGSFSIVALVWRPGQITRVHDHIAREN